MDDFYALLARSADENGTVKIDALRNVMLHEKQEQDGIQKSLQTLNPNQAASKRPRNESKRPQTASSHISRHGSLLLKLASGPRPTSAVQGRKKTELHCNINNLAVPLIVPPKQEQAKIASEDAKIDSKPATGPSKPSAVQTVPTTVLLCRPPSNPKPAMHVSNVASRTPRAPNEGEGGQQGQERSFFPSMPMSDKVIHQQRMRREWAESSGANGGLMVGGIRYGSSNPPKGSRGGSTHQSPVIQSPKDSLPPPVSENSSLDSCGYSKASAREEQSRELESVSPERTPSVSPVEVKHSEWVMESHQEFSRDEPLHDSSRLLVAAVKAIRERDVARAQVEQLEAKVASLQQQLSEAEQVNYRNQVSVSMQKQDFIRRTESLSSELYDAKSSVSELTWKLNVAYRQMESEARFPPGEERAQYRHFIMKWMSSRENAAFSSWSELTYDLILMRRFVKRLMNRKLAKCFDNFVIATRFVQEFDLRDRFIREHEDRSNELEQEWRRMEREREELRRRKEKADEEISLRTKDGRSFDLPVLLSEIRVLTLENLNLRKRLGGLEGE
ncbi:hypothetical protein GUITHDRAFT_122525 [Guillardia theta CCMP2712]|uniref:Uncharacterized protein n=1 Tax=Guillardia theta (strain CCMP2712) TaxID=905079 RepID=L1I5Y8_GUITC|nr:hypothetical protein GUITHDRAFT_122525 [Guillardia theta CCMP2712]EKX31274.1 hypothetical protein GUITHDRAFT_122525 [Guillardia theta CCMP2712]|eukprot:XP_005818254.1 hypothetical protein GUITHDRAFT_122525 [Guillardia theta CCMP2712]